MSRLADAIDAYLARSSTSGAGEATPGAADFLSAHAELAEFLEPMLNSGAEDAPAATADHPAGDSLPEQIGSYRVIREIGRGGMGIVYEAEHLTLGRRVALKVLPALLSLSARRIERFLREARAVARLEHPGLARVHEVGEVDGTWFFAMELVEGATLRDLAREIRQSCGRDPRRLGDRPRLDLPDAISRYDEIATLGIQIAEALHCVHQSGLVHRDVKPQNILLDRSKQTRLVDFGLAKDLRDANLTLTGDFAGTPHYGSPEQVAADRPLDGRSDLFALGAVLYELLALRRPFEGETTEAVLRAIREDEPRPVRTLAPGVPRDLETIVMRCLEKAPERRYPDAAELASDLRRFRERAPIHARPVATARRLLRWTAKHRSRAALLALLFLLLVVAPAITAALLQRQNGELQRQRDAARDNLALARQTVDSLFTMVAEQDLPEQPHLQRFRRQLLDAARGFYVELDRRQLAQQSPGPDEALDDDPATRTARQVRALQAGLRLARLDIELGRTSDAHLNLDEAVGQLEQLLAEPTAAASRAVLRDELAAVLADRGLAAQALGDTANAQHDLDRSSALWQELLDDPAAPRGVVTRSALRLARMLMKRGDAAEPHSGEAAAADFRQALDLLDAHEPPGLDSTALDRCRAHAGLARIAVADRRIEAAAAALQAARDSLPPVGDGGRARLIVAAKLRHTSGRLAELRGEPSAAARELSDAHQQLQMLRDDFPGDELLRYSCAVIGSDLARVLFSARLDAAGARAAIIDALADSDRLLAEAGDPHPERLDWLAATTRAYAALVLSSTHGPDGPDDDTIDEWFASSVAIRRQLLVRHPGLASLHGTIGGTLNNHARWLLQQPPPDEAGAAELLEQAVAAQREARRIAPDSGVWRRYLHNHLFALSAVEQARGDLTRARELLLEALAEDPGDPGATYQLDLARRLAAHLPSTDDARHDACRTAAIDALLRAATADRTTTRSALDEPRFAPLRADPRIQDLRRR